MPACGNIGLFIFLFAMTKARPSTHNPAFSSARVIVCTIAVHHGLLDVSVLPEQEQR